MPYELSVNTDLQFVDLKYSGTIELAERSRARDEVFQLCRAQQVSRALVDLSESNIVMSEADVVKFASAFRDADLPENYHLACVTRTDNGIDNFLEILISIDGINVRYFLNREDAINWLTAF